MNIFGNLKAIRFGPGVVSKNVMSFAVLALVGVVLGFAEQNETFRYVVLAMIGLGFLITHALNTFFISRHPEAALLEGSEAVAYHRMQVQQAKGLAKPPEDQIISSPLRRLPAADVEIEDAEVYDG